MFFVVLEKIFRRNYKEIEQVVRILPDIVKYGLLIYSCAKGMVRWWGTLKVPVPLRIPSGISAVAASSARLTPRLVREMY
jgi:hypothetical protein